MRHARQHRPSTALAAMLAVCAAAILATAGCNRDGTPPPKASSWPVFHGTSDLVGVADTTLPAQPALVWKRKVGDSVKSSPVIDGDRVYVGTDEGLVALDLAGGRIVWKFATKNTVEGPPLVVGDTVFVGSTDHRFYAVDAATGKVRWKHEAGGEFMGGANVYRPAGGRETWVLVGNYDYKLYCFDAADGRIVWTYETSNYINGTPAVAGDKVIVGGCDGKVHVLSAQDGKKIREIDAGAYVAGGVAVSGSRAYLSQFGNEVRCFDINSGNAIWTFTEAESPYYSTPAVGADVIVVGCRDYSIYGLACDTGRLRWKVATLEDVDSSPAIAGDKTVIGSKDGRLYLLATDSGKVLWSYDCGQPVSSSPAVASGLIVIGCEDGTIYAFGHR